MEIDKSLDHFLIDLSLILIEFFSFDSIQIIRGNPSFDGFVEDDGRSLSAGNIVDFENDGGKESGLFRFFLEPSFKDFANSVVWVDFFVEKVLCPAFEMFIRFDLQLLAMVSFSHIFHNSIE